MHDKEIKYVYTANWHVLILTALLEYYTLAININKMSILYKTIKSTLIKCSI